MIPALGTKAAGRNTNDAAGYSGFTHWGWVIMKQLAGPLIRQTP